MSTLGPQAWGAGLRAFRSGARQTTTKGHPFQQGGVLVIAPGTKVLYRHVSSTAGDHAPLDRVLAALRSAARRPRGLNHMQFGRYFEEFEVGATYRHWPGKTITEADDHLFCLLTMNHHPLHTDAHYAETKTEFGRNVVVGNLVYSLAIGMSVADVSGKAIANLEVESLKHEHPTFHGDTIYAETTVLEKRESSTKPDRAIVTVETRAFNQRGERVCIFKRRVMVPKREAGELQPPDIPAGAG